MKGIEHSKKPAEISKIYEGAEGSVEVLLKYLGMTVAFILGIGSQ